jgi:hypothetical protein
MTAADHHDSDHESALPEMPVSARMPLADHPCKWVGRDGAQTVGEHLGIAKPIRGPLDRRADHPTSQHLRFERLQLRGGVAASGAHSSPQELVCGLAVPIGLPGHGGDLGPWRLAVKGCSRGHGSISVPLLLGPRSNRGAVWPFTGSRAVVPEGKIAPTSSGTALLRSMRAPLALNGLPDSRSR